MIDPSAIRSRLEARISQAEHQKFADRRPLDASCTHSWQVYRQTVVPTNSRFKGSGAHFIVRGCSLCRGKRLIDYVVERI